MGGGVPGEVEERVRGALDGLAGRDVDLFLVRLRRWWGDLADGLGGRTGNGTTWGSCWSGSRCCWPSGTGSGARS